MSDSALQASAYRIDKQRAAATLALADGTSVQGWFFLAATRGIYSPERIKDLLNSESGFFPFELGDRGIRRTTLYNRDHVLYVRLAADDEPHQEPAYGVATRRAVSMLLKGGRRLHGVVRVYCPEGRDRLSDYTRSAEVFRYLEAPDGTLVVNTRHVIEIEETQGP